MDNIFETILELFNPTSIYDQLDGAIGIYIKIVVPAVIILSIATRFVELQVENLGQGAKWSEAIKDIQVSIIFTGLYAGFGALVIKFHQVLCATMYSHGSLHDLLGGYQAFLQQIKSSHNDGVLDKLNDTISSYSVESVLTQSIWFLSMVLLALVNVILRIIYALGFCLLYLWGMFAVPTMSSKLLNVASGWFRGVMTLFLWPLVESSIYLLLNPMFAGLSEKIASVQLGAVGTKIAGISLLYAFANILLCTVGVGAFFLSVVITMNQNFMSGLGTSMLATWAASTSLVMNAAKLMGSASSAIKGFPAHGATTGGVLPGAHSISGQGQTGSLDGFGGGNGGPANTANSGAIHSPAQGSSDHGTGLDAGATTLKPSGSATAGAEPPGNTSTANAGQPVSATHQGLGAPPASDKAGTKHVPGEAAESAAANMPGINDLKPY